jgi:hypothetical protein
MNVPDERGKNAMCLSREAMGAKYDGYKLTLTTG